LLIIPIDDVRNLKAKHFVQLIDTIQHAHSKAYYHRDVRAENIFIDKDDNILLSDWGFAIKANTVRICRHHSICFIICSFTIDI